MKKLLALMLALVMVFALVACSSEPAADADEEKKSETAAAKDDEKGEEKTYQYAGDWKADVLFSNYLDKAINASALKKVDLDACVVKDAVVFHLNSDGTFKVEMDKEALSAAATTIVTATCDAMEEYAGDIGYDFEQMNGVTREDFEATLKEAMLSIEDSEGEGTWKEEENVITLTYGEKEHVLYSVRPASSHQYFLENMNGIKLYGINK